MTLDEYIAWAAKELGVDYNSPGLQTRYRLNASTALAQIEQSNFGTTLHSLLSKCMDDYEVANVRLFPDFEVRRQGVIWKQKSFESIINKSYRLNVLKNEGFPAAPQSGWCTDMSLYSSIDDVVRSTIVTRYISGAELVVTKIQEHLISLGFDPRVSRQESDHGYYSFHLHWLHEVDIVGADFTPYTDSCGTELQVTTQLQDALYDLTHRFYEKRRIDESFENDASWKWDAFSARFKACYAGHALHMIEGTFEELVREQKRLGAVADEQ